MSYAIVPAMTALASLIRTALVPASLNYVYSDIPLVFSESAPVMFFEYRGGQNQPDSEEQIQSATRTWRVDCVALQCLMSEADSADKLTKAFVGTFYDLMRNNPTLSGTVDKAIVTDDAVQAFPVNGGAAGQSAVYLANVFTLEITEYKV